MKQTDKTQSDVTAAFQSDAEINGMAADYSVMDAMAFLRLQRDLAIQLSHSKT